MLFELVFCQNLGPILVPDPAKIARTAGNCELRAITTLRSGLGRRLPTNHEESHKEKTDNENQALGEQADRRAREVHVLLLQSSQGVATDVQ